MTKDDLIAELDAAIQFPGLTNAWTMPIKTRIDMLSTGIKTPVGIKVGGPDLSELERIIDDPLVEVLPPVSWRPSGPPSSLDTELFQSLERTQRLMYPEAMTLPYMITGATDAAQLRAAGIPTYGIGAGGDAAHGNDERISVDAMHR